MADGEEACVDGKPLSTLRVIDLKQELEKRGLPKAGTKTELLERLTAQLLLEELQNAPIDQDTVPNLKLQDEIGTENEYIRQYLTQQQHLYEIQKEAKRKAELEETEQLLMQNCQEEESLPPSLVIEANHIGSESLNKLESPNEQDYPSPPKLDREEVLETKTERRSRRSTRIETTPELESENIQKKRNNSENNKKVNTNNIKNTKRKAEIKKSNDKIGGKRQKIAETKQIENAENKNENFTLDSNTIEPKQKNERKRGKNNPETHNKVVVIKVEKINEKTISKFTQPSAVKKIPERKLQFDKKQTNKLSPGKSQKCITSTELLDLTPKVILEDFRLVDYKKVSRSASKDKSLQLITKFLKSSVLTNLSFNHSANNKFNDRKTLSLKDNSKNTQLQNITNHSEMEKTNVIKDKEKCKKNSKPATASKIVKKQMPSNKICESEPSLVLESNESEKVNNSKNIRKSTRIKQDVNQVPEDKLLQVEASLTETVKENESDNKKNKKISNVRNGKKQSLRQKAQIATKESDLSISETAINEDRSLRKNNPEHQNSKNDESNENNEKHVNEDKNLRKNNSEQLISKHDISNEGNGKQIIKEEINLLNSNSEQQISKRNRSKESNKKKVANKERNLRKNNSEPLTPKDDKSSEDREKQIVSEERNLNKSNSEQQSLKNDKSKETDEKQVVNIEKNVYKNNFEQQTSKRGRLSEDKEKHVVTEERNLRKNNSQQQISKRGKSNENNEKQFLNEEKNLCKNIPEQQISKHGKSNEDNEKEIINEDKNLRKNNSEQQASKRGRSNEDSEKILKRERSLRKNNFEQLTSKRGRSTEGNEKQVVNEERSLRKNSSDQQIVKCDMPSEDSEKQIEIEEKNMRKNNSEQQTSKRDRSSEDKEKHNKKPKYEKESENKLNKKNEKQNLKQVKEKKIDKIVNVNQNSKQKSQVKTTAATRSKQNSKQELENDLKKKDKQSALEEEESKKPLPPKNLRKRSIDNINTKEIPKTKSRKIESKEAETIKEEILKPNFKNKNSHKNQEKITSEQSHEKQSCKEELVLEQITEIITNPLDDSGNKCVRKSNRKPIIKKKMQNKFIEEDKLPIAPTPVVDLKSVSNEQISSTKNRNKDKKAVNKTNENKSDINAKLIAINVEEKSKKENETVQTEACDNLTNTSIETAERLQIARNRNKKIPKKKAVKNKKQCSKKMTGVTKADSESFQNTCEEKSLINSDIISSVNTSNQDIKIAEETPDVDNAKSLKGLPLPETTAEESEKELNEFQKEENTEIQTSIHGDDKKEAFNLSDENTCEEMSAGERESKEIDSESSLESFDELVGSKNKELKAELGDEVGDFETFQEILEQSTFTNYQESEQTGEKKTLFSHIEDISEDSCEHMFNKNANNIQEKDSAIPSNPVQTEMQKFLTSDKKASFTVNSLSFDYERDLKTSSYQAEDVSYKMHPIFSFGLPQDNIEEKKEKDIESSTDEKEGLDTWQNSEADRKKEYAAENQNTEDGVVKNKFVTLSEDKSAVIDSQLITKKFKEKSYGTEKTEAKFEENIAEIESRIKSPFKYKEEIKMHDKFKDIIQPSTSPDSQRSRGIEISNVPKHRSRSRSNSKERPKQSYSKEPYKIKDWGPTTSSRESFAQNRNKEGFPIGNRDRLQQPKDKFRRSRSRERAQQYDNWERYRRSRSKERCPQSRNRDSYGWPRNKERYQRSRSRERYRRSRSRERYYQDRYQRSRNEEMGKTEENFKKSRMTDMYNQNLPSKQFQNINKEMCESFRFQEGYTPFNIKDRNYRNFALDKIKQGGESGNKSYPELYTEDNVL